MPSYLSLLFWLKWKLMFRGYQRNKMAMIGVIIAFLFFAPMALGAAIGTGIGYRLLPAPFNEYLLRAVLFGIYCIWIFSPIIGFVLNESYDISRLFPYPVSPRQIFIGTILSSFIDFPVLLALPLFAAVVLGFPGSAQFVLLSAVVLALFLFHTLALSQAVVLASAGALRSRRWRDIMAVLSPLLALGFYLLFQVVPRYMVKMDWHLMLDNPAWRWVNYLPPGLAARAAGAANQGTWLPALGLLLLLAVITAITVYLAGYLVQLVSVGEGISNQARKRPAAPRQSTPGLAPASLAASRINRWIPPVVAAVAGKEWKYLFRDPLFKANLMQMIYMFVVLIFAFVLPRHTEYGMNLEPIMLWIPAGILLFGGTTLAFNIFGTDGAAAATLFLFPSSRRQIIIGKNLVLSLANMAVNLGLLLLLHILLRSFAHLWQQGVLLVMGAAILTATGNVISVFFPTRMVMRGWRMQQQSAGKGCGRGLMSMLGTFCSTLLMLPVVTAIIVPTFWVHPAWFALSLPLAAGYVIFLYVYSLQITPDILIKREMEIMATMLAEE